MIPSGLNLVPLAIGLLGFGIVLLRWPEMGTLLATAILYLNLLPIALRLHDVPPILAASSVALVAPPLLKYWVIDRDRVIIDRPFLLMLVFLACAILSSFIAARMDLALDWLVRFLAEGIFVYFLFINLVRTKETLRRVMWVLLLCGAFLATLTVYQELTKSYSHQFGGLAGRALARETERTLLLEQFDRGDPSILSDARRAEGPIDDPNRYAQMLIVLLPLGWCLFRTETSMARKAAAVVCSAFVVAAVLLTYSRGGFLGMLVMFLLMGIFRMVTLRQMVVVAAAVMISIAVLSPGYTGRMVTLRGLEGFIVPTSEPGIAPDAVQRYRAALMLAAWNLFLDHPILGVGPGQFANVYSIDYASAFYSLRRVSEQMRAHSMYLELAAETGVIGLTMFIAVIIAVLRRLTVARRRSVPIDPFVANSATAFLVAIPAYLTTAVFLQLSYQRYYWLLLAIAGATVGLAERLRIARSELQRVSIAD